VYAVGTKTAEALRLGLGVEARGAAAGRAAALAPIMAADLAGAGTPAHDPSCWSWRVMD